MTIIYQYRVATTSLGGFLRLLRAWKGSVYKLLFKELFIFVALYGSISLVYRLGLTGTQRIAFESVVVQLHQVTSSIPLSFVLGFYVTFIVQRWWQQFSNVPWPDRTLFVMASYLHGSDDKARMMRRSIARYMLFSFILITRAVSVAVMKRFPTIDHVVEAGFITKEESELYDSTTCQYLKFWVPLMWANSLLVTAHREGRIDNDFGLRMVLEQLADFRDKCSLCFVYDWITVPLVYTQVVTFAVYSYFAACLMGQQYLDPSKGYDGFDRDFYVPGFTILQFLFYMGWLKVAEQMINPFGEDDDDYDINWLLDRHTAVAFALVDQCYGRHPPLSRDQFWNDVSPDVPYTESSLNSIRPNFLGSTFNMARPSIDVEKMLVPDHEELIHPHLLALRQRSKGSFSGSLLSLFPFRHHRSHGHGDSRDTLASNGSGHGRLFSIPNGKTRYHVIPGKKNDGESTRRSSFDLRRERSSTEYHFQECQERKRKLSLPFSLGLASKSTKKLDTTPSASPKLTRFTVEPVKDDFGKDLAIAGTDANSSVKTRRSGHASVTFQNSDKVSRVPILSAIEEGNTITSLRQVVPTVSRASNDSNGSNNNANHDNNTTATNNTDEDNSNDKNSPNFKASSVEGKASPENSNGDEVKDLHTGHNNGDLNGKENTDDVVNYDDHHIGDHDDDNDSVFTFEYPFLDLDINIDQEGLDRDDHEDEENLIRV